MSRKNSETRLAQRGSRLLIGRASRSVDDRRRPKFSRPGGGEFSLFMVRVLSWRAAPALNRSAADETSFGGEGKESGSRSL
ncbi:unnamed protein product [Leptosia nina]|uniref:Uncharacterized protein n=1 Tax=Leptosia nina TaxID=320188 RepID=A0AAV1JII8_9NEOP